MNILIFEYITSGGMVDHALPSSLVREGEMMLNAVVRDFEAIPNVDVSALRDYRLINKINSANDIIIEPQQNYVEKLNVQSDALLVIAPETSQILTSICERFSKQTPTLLNSKIEAIKLTSNKYDTYKYLQAYDIPQISTYLSHEIENINADQFVMKSADGAGCGNLFLLHSRTELEHAVARHAGEQFIIQPYIQGVHASLSLLCWDGECLLLSCNEQCLIEKDGGLELKKCKVNAFDSKKFRLFSKKLVQVLPGLRGYIGVDILITEKEILLVEINPRLTTSYVGLRGALGANPAELMLDCFTRRQLPILKNSKNIEITVDLEEECAA